MGQELGLQGKKHNKALHYLCHLQALHYPDDNVEYLSYRH